MRELRRVERDRVPWPSELVDRVRHVVDAVTAAGHGPQQVSDEELRRRLEDAQDERLRDAQFQVLRKEMPLATFASMAGRSYGQLLLQRSLGAIIAADDHPGLQAAGAEAAAAALAAGGAVAELSAVHLLQLLGRDGQLLRHRLPDLRTTTSTVDDAIRSRDAIWVSVGASHLVRLEGGVLRREEVSATSRALLRRRAAELEDMAAALPHDPVPGGPNPGDDVITLAEREGLAMYSDDCALRAQARARGVPAFGTTELIAATGLPAEKTAELVMTLAAEYVVDLPLTGEQAAALQAATGWPDGPGVIPLNRHQWWQQPGDRISAWRTVARAAAAEAPQELVSVTRVALGGALEQCDPGRMRQRYQQVVVAALLAAHEAGSGVPADFLTQLAEPASPEIIPEPMYVHLALFEALRAEGVTDPGAVAASLLPQFVIGPAA
ncbi:MULTISPECIES: hypothetical protein [unclassified Micromonospora]|uniref:hypothetical protein n=1 Tax=unclassified Micromonospora TaxID=2617518 RepID=UPI002FEFB010